MSEYKYLARGGHYQNVVDRDDCCDVSPVAATEGMLAVLHNVHWRYTGGADWALTPSACPSCRYQAAAVAAYLDDESECSVCATADEVRADAPRHAGWSEAMRFAHHAHADETSNGYPSANGVLGAGPDAVIVDGDWLAQVEADLAAARAALDRVTTKRRRHSTAAWVSGYEAALAWVRAVLDVEDDR